MSGGAPCKIAFASGGRESNILAIKGAAHFHRQFGKDHVVTVATEHKCVLESALALEREGFRLTVLPVDAQGLVDMDALAAAIDERTAVVSVMAGDHQNGALRPLAALRAHGRSRRCVFLSGAAP